MLRKIGLSPAIDYASGNAHNHCRIGARNVDVVAIQNAAVDNAAPASCAVNEELATLGARMLFAGDEQLSDLLYESGILYQTEHNQPAVSVARFNRVFKDIAYVVLRPQPDDWLFLDKAC